jgi:uncharacterized tellurite resistance protein B-like protein
MDVLKDACPNCKSDLVLKDLKKWFTFFFIPIFPFSTIDSYYQCTRCEASYKKSARQALLGNIEDKSAIERDARKLYAITAIACMTHMANIDGEISETELQEINRFKEAFNDLSSELNKMMKKIITSQNSEETVYALLRKSSKDLSSKAIMNIVELSARVLLTDGRIDKQEENLLKEFLLVCGLPKDLYNTIIEKLKA